MQNHYIYIMFAFLAIPFALFALRGPFFRYRVYRFVKLCITIRLLYNDFNDIYSPNMVKKRYHLYRLSYSIRFKTVPEACEKFEVLINKAFQRFAPLNGRVAENGETATYRDFLIRVQEELSELKQKHES